MPESAATPVLFLVFNRPAVSRQVFAAIRAARPRTLYIAADGPRPGHPTDEERCRDVRAIVSAVDWPCEVHTLFRERNLGCRVAVAGAIDWFFSREPEGIVLEDDCLPDPSFFRFSAELLERYREDPLVMAISGGYYHGRHQASPRSYFFSHHVDVWGWASWRRAWQAYDLRMSTWPVRRATDWLARLGGSHADFTAFWTAMFDAAHAGSLDAWAYQWVYACWARSGVTIMPTRHLVKNIGFGADATRTRGDGGRLERQPLESIAFPLDHPTSTRRDLTADRWLDLHVYGTRGYFLRQQLGRLPGLRWLVRAVRGRGAQS